MVRVVKSTEKAGEGAVKNVPGNHYDKHGSKNPLIKFLMDTFHDKTIDAIKSTGARKAIDVGCGEGHTTAYIRDKSGITISGIDLEDVMIAQAKQNYPKIMFKVGSAYKLPFKSKSIPLVISTEVLEHVDTPSRAIKEMKRVSSSYCIFSVPNEPLWRIGNVVRGAYLSDFGNTPGHVNHWSPRAFRRLLEPHFKEVRIIRAIMWTIAICKR